MQYLFSLSGTSTKQQQILKLAYEQPPLTLELFDKSRLEEFCKIMAKRHRLVDGYDINDLLEELSENENTIHLVHEWLTESGENRQVSRELIQTNFYIIQHQIEKVRNILHKMATDLPRLAGNPRVLRIHNIANRIVLHTNAQVEPGILPDFIAAYQSVSNLRIQELKGFGTVLKLALLSHLRRRALRLASAQIDEQQADHWAERITIAARNGLEEITRMLEGLLRSGILTRNVFVVELVRRLQSNKFTMSLPLEWLRLQLSNNGLTLQEIMHAVDQERTADRVFLRNCVSSLRLLDTVDWQKFLDVSSVIEPMLCKDGSGIYLRMDFYTREYYRDEVGKIAKMAGLSELDVARWVVLLSRHNTLEKSEGDPASHVGFFLIGPGRRQMEISLGINPSKWGMFRTGKLSLRTYLGTITALTLLMSGALFMVMHAGHVAGGLLLIAGMSLVLASSQLAKFLTDALARFLHQPILLPRLDFSRGIPQGSRTLVVVPAILTDESEIAALVHALEVHFLANRSDNLHFGLLTDFTDARQETLPGDHSLIQLMQQKITALNLKYGSAAQGIFFLFHRPRQWNEAEQVWMGYERKRGKLMELNAFLRNKANSSFSHIIGDRSIFPEIKYVITLDTDTQLPREAAWKLVATMAHPLNRGVYCEKKKRVVTGYGMLQPRVATDLRGLNGSLYQRINGAGPDIDPYTKAAADLYQDLFGEGSFVGKGIYDVDIMIRALHDRFPDNRILSHDLIEGCYARSGLLSDVSLYEKPLNYLIDVKRRHRWMRGDWQIARWVGPVVPAPGKRSVRNPLSALSRWKIFDNLRNSLVPLALLILLVLGWTTLPYTPVWTLFAISVLLTPWLLVICAQMLEHPRGFLSISYWRSSFHEASACFMQGIYAIICLPFEVLCTVDAMLRVGWRLLVSRRKLLEWVPAGSLRHSQYNNPLNTYRAMWIAPLTSALVGLYLAAFQLVAILWAAPVLLIWMASPATVWQLGRSSKLPREMLTVSRHAFLRKLARKTWSYFESFMKAELNWLPPDHYQEYPVGKIADYTSPTNMGLALLANLSARDFGFIPTGKFIEYTVNILNAMERLERYRGHFYNWYNIRSMKPSLPRYVSTVDSGNLAGHLLTLRQGIKTIPGEPILHPEVFAGIRDTLALLQDVIDPLLFPRWCRRAFRIADPSVKTETLEQSKLTVERIVACCERLMGALHIEPGSDAACWLAALGKQCRDIDNELRLLAPWLWLPATPLKYQHLLPKHVPSLQELEGIDIPEHSVADTEEEKAWIDQFTDCMAKAKCEARQRIASVERLIWQCDDFADMAYDFLYDESEQLLSIGYDVENQYKDTNCYDVLASEARLATFIGICQNKLPTKSWFALGRAVVNTGHRRLALLSANGTMFEYLMPLLVMPSYRNTLLDEACRAAVNAQIAYGKLHRMPWGVSESCYATVNAGLSYQYKVFGIPNLSLKHDYPGDDKVIAPYASALALMIAPNESIRNLEQLSACGFEGRYGFFESIDYTSSRATGGRDVSIVRSFMAHHQGMSLLSYASLLLNNLMQKRFADNPQVESTLLLLQERMPKDAVIRAPLSDRDKPEVKDAAVLITGNEPGPFNIHLSSPRIPQVQLLSNGRYHAVMTSAGRACRRWNDIVITGEESEGVRFTISDIEQPADVTTIVHPAGWPDGNSKAIFSLGRIAYHTCQSDLDIHSQLVISPENDLELQQLTIQNCSGKQRTIELTSCVEVALAASQGEPYPMTLPCHTEIKHARYAILCGRPMLHDAQNPWLFVKMTVRGTNVVSVGYMPDCLRQEFDNTILVIQYKIIIQPGETTVADLYLGIGEDKHSCYELLQKCDSESVAEYLLRRARSYSQTVLRQINATEDDAELFRRIAGELIVSQDLFRQQGPVRHDMMFTKEYTVLLRMHKTYDIEVASHMIQMHAYWRLMGFTVNLIIWNEDPSDYHHFLQRMVVELIINGVGAEALNRHQGGIFVKDVHNFSNDDYSLLEKADRIITGEEWNALLSQVKWGEKQEPEPIAPSLDLVLN